MRRFGFVGLLFSTFGIAASASASPASGQVDVWLQAGVSIDARGQVVALDWVVPKPAYALISERLTPAVKAWQFVPATVDGEAVDTRTGLLIHVVAQAQRGELRLRFERAITGPMAISMQPPRYPQEAMRADASALVVSQVRVTSDGAPVVETLRVSSNRGHREAFERASRDAIAHWTFKPEIVAGRAVASTIRIPITFCMQSGGCQRLDAESEQGRVVDLPKDVHIAPATAVALKTDIRAQAI